jgi:hypothetical protein
MPSCWVELPQARRISGSERVALRLVLPRVVVTWFVTGFPDIGKADGSMRCLLSLLPPARQAYSDRTSRCRRRLAPWRHNPCRGFLAVARALHLERPGEMGKPGIPITAKAPEHDHAFLHGVKLAPAQAGTPHRRSTWPSTGSAENKFSAASPAGTRSPYDNPGDHKKGRR